MTYKSKTHYGNRKYKLKPLDSTAIKTLWYKRYFGFLWIETHCDYFHNVYKDNITMFVSKAKKNAEEVIIRIVTREKELKLAFETEGNEMLAKIEDYE